MTGLSLRPALDKALKNEIKRAVKSQESFSLILLDINHFKSINDAFGHAVGDRILADFARFLVGSVRQSDAAFRIGGDPAVLMEKADQRHYLSQSQLTSWLSEAPFWQQWKR